MQQLLTGKKRFAGFKGKWKKVALGDVAENVADQNKGRMGTTSLYGVTKADGVVPMADLALFLGLPRRAVRVLELSQ